jgi:molybdopterin molybdotransferase
MIELMSKTKMVSVHQAVEEVLGRVLQLEAERVPVRSAVGRVLAEDLVAPWDLPPRDNSAMDGYAVRYQDVHGALRENPSVLRVVDVQPAGAVSKKRVETGTAIKVMTGAGLPQGADAVVMMEDTASDDDRVKVFKSVERMENVRPRGEELKKGERVLSRGEVLHPAEIGMTAAFGHSTVLVSRQPTVAILATGNELTEPVAGPDPKAPGGKIFNSNSYSLAAQVVEAGAVPRLLGVAGDAKPDLLHKLRLGLEEDMLLVSGGVSVGDHDLVKQAFEEVGVEKVFWKVAMKPGQPLFFGLSGKKLVFGLPGNPVSTMVTFEQFVRPALLKMMRCRMVRRPVVQACLEDEIVKPLGKTAFLRSVVKEREGKLFVRATEEQGSGMLLSLVKANGLIIVEEDREKVFAGATVKVQLLGKPFAGDRTSVNSDAP